MQCTSVVTSLWRMEEQVCKSDKDTFCVWHKGADFYPFYSYVRHLPAVDAMAETTVSQKLQVQAPRTL